LDSFLNYDKVLIAFNMKPKEVVTKWVEAFNAVDAERLAELYSDQAINQQVNSLPLEGKAAIKQMFTEEFAKAEMVCISENIFEVGEWAILEWKEPLGSRGCGFFQVVAGKIRFQRGYWDRLSFLRIHHVPIPTE
jgi:hypothetical protein